MDASERLAMVNSKLDDFGCIYTGGSCSSLALYLHNKHNCTIFEVSGRERGQPRTYGWHFFVQHDGEYFDAYGWSKDVDGILYNFEEFSSDDKLIVHKRSKNYKKELLEYEDIINGLWHGTISHPNYQRTAPAARYKLSWNLNVNLWM